MSNFKIDCKVSVCIPTYNRYQILKENLNLFLKVKNKNFEIVIVDDGSTDDTRLLVEQIRKKAKFKIKYFYQNNQGIFKSLSKAILKSNGEFTVYQGSDDLVIVEEFEKFLEGKYQDKLNYSDVAGISFRCFDYNNKMVGIPHRNEFYSNYSQVHYLNNNRGDKKIFIKTYVYKKVVKKYLDFDNHIPPAVLLIEIDKNFKFYFCDIAIAIKNYLKDGVTNNYFNHIRKNPNGYLVLCSKILGLKIKKNKNILFLKFKQTINFTRYLFFCIFLRKKITHLDKFHLSYYIIILVMSPIGILLFFYDNLKLNIFK